MVEDEPSRKTRHCLRNACECVNIGNPVKPEWNIFSSISVLYIAEYRDLPTFLFHLTVDYQ